MTPRSDPTDFVLGNSETTGDANAGTRPKGPCVTPLALTLASTPADRCLDGGSPWSPPSVTVYLRMRVDQPFVILERQAGTLFCQGVAPGYWVAHWAGTSRHPACWGVGI